MEEIEGAIRLLKEPESYRRRSGIEFLWKFSRILEKWVKTPPERRLEKFGYEEKTRIYMKYFYQEPEKIIKALLEYIEGKENKSKAEAIQVLGRIGDATAVPPLLELLHSENQGLRVEAIAALGLIGDRRAIDPIIACLNDSNEGVGASAVNSIANFDDEDVIEPLIAYLSDEHPLIVRKRAVKALALIGNERALEPLLGLLREKDFDLIRFVVLAIQSLGDVVSPIIASLQDKDWWVKVNATKALKFIRRGATWMFDKKSAGDLDKIADNIREKSLEPLIACLKDDDPRVREAAISVIGTRDEAKQKLLANHLLECLRDSEPRIRTFAAFRLGAMQDTRVVEFLIKLLHDESMGIRLEAATALMNYNDPRYISILLDYWNELDELTRLRLLDYLERKKVSGAVTPVTEVLKNDPNPKIRASAARTLGVIGDMKVIKPLLYGLIDRAIEVRDNSAAILGRRDIMIVMKQMNEIIKQDPDWFRLYLEKYSSVFDYYHQAFLRRILAAYHQDPDWYKPEWFKSVLRGDDEYFKRRFRSFSQKILDIEWSPEIKKTFRPWVQQIEKRFEKNYSDSYTVLDIGTSEFKDVRITPKEREALVELRQEIENNIHDPSGLLQDFNFKLWRGHVTELELCGLELSSMPMAIVKFEQLQTLNLSENSLSSVPEDLSELKLLQTLDLSWNQLIKLPESLGNLESLQNLNLSHNALASLPRSFGSLQSLENVDLQVNDIADLPESLLNLSNSLKRLSVEKNPLNAGGRRILERLTKEINVGK